MGQQISARTLGEIVQELRRIEPSAFPDIETIAPENGNTVIALCPTLLPMDEDWIRRACHRCAGIANPPEGFFRMPLMFELVHRAGI